MKDYTILAHNYQNPEIQDMADHVGDTLKLCKIAKEAEDIKYIIFAGVKFMGENAKILNPDKVVLLPNPNSICPLVQMAQPELLVEARDQFPNATIVAYTNSSYDVKAVSDITVTSANAVRIINKLDANEIIFTPDKNLASYVQMNSNKRIIPVPNFGYCITHDSLSVQDIKKSKAKHPKAIIISHPECRKEILDISDYIKSTEGMVEVCKTHPSKEFIIGTDVNMIYRLKKECPDKDFYSPSPDKLICQNQRKITLDQIKYVVNNRNDLKKIQGHIVNIDPKNAKLARKPLLRMFKMG